MISLQTVPVSQKLVRARTYKVCKVKPDTVGESRIGRVRHFVHVTREGIIILSYTLQVISNLDNSKRTLNIVKKSSSYIALFQMPKKKKRAYHNMFIATYAVLFLKSLIEVKCPIHESQNISSNESFVQF